MKKVLMIAPDSFPVTGAESIVNIKLLQALSESGLFSIDLISRQRKWTNYPSDTLDSFNVRLHSLKVIEVDNRITITTIVQSLFTFFKFGTAFKGCHWAIVALKSIIPLVRNNQYDYVLTKNAPSYLIGNYLKKKYGIKWIATWNDPYPDIKYPAPYGAGKDCKENILIKKEIAIMRNADIHIFPSKRLCDYMMSYLRTSYNANRIIPHVVLESRINNNKRTKRDTLRFIHSGNLGNYRNPEGLLIAFKRFLDSTKAEATFTFMGKVNPTFTKIVKDLDLEDYISYRDPLEYKASLRELFTYDIAVILEANCEEGIFLPTKVSDFLQERIPILAVSPANGVLNDLYKEGRISYFAPLLDIDEIQKVLSNIYKDFMNGTLREVSEIRDDFLSTSIVKVYSEM